MSDRPDSSPHPVNPLEEGLVHEDVLRLRVDPLDGLPSSLTLDHLNADNAHFLRGLAAMEEHAEPMEEGEGLQPELARIDMKLNLLMDLVGDLLSRQAGLPEPSPVRFNAHGLAWTNGQAYPPGTLLALDLYLHSSLPRPLHLFGEVVPPATTTDACMIAFVGLPEGLRDLIEKHVFRAHRRQVARQRAAAGD